MPWHSQLQGKGIPMPLIIPGLPQIKTADFDRSRKYGAWEHTGRKIGGWQEDFSWAVSNDPLDLSHLFDNAERSLVSGISCCSVVVRSPQKNSREREGK